MYRWVLIIFGIVFATAAWAQSTVLSLSGETHDRTLPVDIQADALSVNQDAQIAVFTGNAVVKQGGLVLSADEISVNYSEDGSEIETVNAKGNVAFSNSTETAESEAAQYQVASGDLTMSGNVVLVQGPSRISGNQLDMNIVTNIAQMSGNVRTRLVPQ